MNFTESWVVLEILQSHHLLSNNVEQRKKYCLENWKKDHLERYVEFHMKEHECASKFGRRRNPHIPDAVTCQPLAKLGPAATRALPHIYNATHVDWGAPTPFMEDMANCLLLKPDKSTKAIGSFRPVCITICVVKVLEKMVHHRLQRWFERDRVFPDKTSGFCPGSSTMNSVLYLVYFVEHEGVN